MTRTTDQAAAVLPALLTTLRLPSIHRNWKRLTDTADRDGWPAAHLLASLLEIEMAERTSRRIQRHRDQSGLPAGKTFATFVSTRHQASASRTCLFLATGDGWIDSGDNLLIFGQSGTGKTHTIAAIGHVLIDTGRASCSAPPPTWSETRRPPRPACLDARQSSTSTIIVSTTSPSVDQIEPAPCSSSSPIATSDTRSPSPPISLFSMVGRFPCPAMTVAASTGSHHPPSSR